MPPRESGSCNCYPECPPGCGCYVANGHDSCPILDLIKLALFVIIAAFVLILPLGDPNAVCTPKNGKGCKTLPICCLCSVYKFLLRTAVNLTEILDAVAVMLSNVLHELKIACYRVMEAIDGKDLCASVCQKCASPNSEIPCTCEDKTGKNPPEKES